MKIYSFVLLLIVLCSCKDSASTSEKNEFENFTAQRIDFLNKKVYVPSSYKKINFNELNEMQRQNPEQNPIDSWHLNFAKRLQKETNKLPIAFEDSIFKGRNIFFIALPYIKIEKSLITQYVQVYEANNISPLRTMGLNAERVQASYFVANGGKGFKLKYKVFNEYNFQYFTEYLYTKDMQTLNIRVINNTEEDYQNILKSL